MIKTAISSAFLTLVMASCTRYAYFQSPMHVNSNAYRTVPFKGDSLKSAIYASGTLTAGGAGESLRDGVTAFIGSLHRAHSFGNFEAYYGGTLALGNYKVDSVNQTTDARFRNRNLDDVLINSRSGNKFFGATGAVAGINLSVPFTNGGEWRIAGAEFSWTHELGSYYAFRNSLPDTAANLVDRHRNFYTAALSTEFIFRIGRGYLGYKCALVKSLRNLAYYDEDRKRSYWTSAYATQTLHISQGRITGFCQVSFGSRAAAVQFGANVLISRLPGK